MSFIKKHYKKIIIIAIVAIVAFLIYRNVTAPKTSKTDTAKVERGTLTKELSLSGKIQANEHEQLTFQTGGRLLGVGVKEGDYVARGQWVASLDQRDIQKRIEKYLNTYEKTRRDFDQTLDDNDDKVLTDAIKRTLDKSQRDLNNAVLDVEIQSLAKEFAHLYTPVEGLVTRIDTPNPGVNIVLPASAVFEIVNPKTVYLSATADQSEVTSLKQGLPGKIVLDSFLESTMSGQIQTIGFTPKEGETGTVYEVKVGLPTGNEDRKFRLGMSGDVTFELEKKENIIHIPTRFVKTEKDKKYVNVERNGKIEKVEVKTGMETDNDVEITEGLSEGESIYN